MTIPTIWIRTQQTQIDTTLVQTAHSALKIRQVFTIIPIHTNPNSQNLERKLCVCIAVGNSQQSKNLRNTSKHFLKMLGYRALFAKKRQKVLRRLTVMQYINLGK